MLHFMKHQCLNMYLCAYINLMVILHPCKLNGKMCQTMILSKGSHIKHLKKYTMEPHYTYKILVIFKVDGERKRDRGREGRGREDR